MSAKPAPASTDAPKSGGKSKFVLIGLAAVLVLGGGAGGAWYYLAGSKHGVDEARSEAPARAPTYMPMESMVVNLADPGGERVAQVGITLDVDGDRTVSQIKTMMPEIRSRVLMLVSQRSSEELLKRDGKEKLAGDIAAEVSRSLGHEEDELPRARSAAKKTADRNDEEADERPVRKKRRAPPSPVNGVLFSSFIVQ